MNIVIEGCDGSGKTAIAKYLCEHLGMYYWHESSPRALEEYKQMLSSGGVIFDRFCFGQFVYNPEEQRKLSPEELKHLVQDIFPQTHTLLVYVNCPTEVIIKRLLERGEGKPEHRFEMEKWVKNIRGTYRSVLKESGADYIELNGTSTLQEEL